jgi:hypothetical protein
LDFEDTIETVREIVTRLNSPVSNYNLVFSETDDAIEVRVETTRQLDPLFVFVVDAERFRVIKDLELNPDGYKSLTYSSCVELLSNIFEGFYPVFSKINHGVSVVDMLSRVMGKSIRVWKDLARVLCESGQVEFFDLGDSVSFLGTTFRYDVDSLTLYLSGDFEHKLSCRSVMDLSSAIFSIADYLFKREGNDINPILGDRLVDEGMNEAAMEEMEDTMALGEAIDEAPPGPGGFGDDLSSEFEPSGETLENTAPDLDSGKDELLDEVLN